ncbi:MAG: hypothetical protein OXM01_05150 [Gemmatimonadota bacterium]|nr:hypothetical protein [Gemmatimonadota bacterium]
MTSIEIRGERPGDEEAMVYTLQKGVLDEYLAAVEKGRPIGCVNWPLPFVAH